MSGRRSRALRAAFALAYGRPPAGMSIVGHAGAPNEVAYTPSETRRIKKAFLRAKRKRP